jgi:C4-dicarboxylate transporter/malic acid transport protein
VVGGFAEAHDGSMSTLAHPAGPVRPDDSSGSARRPRTTAGRRFLRELEHPGEAVAHLGPNWFAAVMGTGIVANAATLLPRRIPGLHVLAVAAWLLATVLLVVLIVATAAHWRRFPQHARAHASNPAMLPFYGAPPMAVMTVGAGALLVGHDVIGALVVAATCWVVGTLTGLTAAAVVPYRLFTRPEVRPQAVSAVWLMPVVPPMVSAATGAGLVPHLAAGQARETLLLACYALFGLSLAASVATVVLLLARLASDGPGPARGVPTLFIVLGPLGQSVTALNLLGGRAGTAIGQPYAGALRAAGVVLGAPLWGTAVLWLVLAGTIVARTARRGLPFSLTWWSFTFPVGTVVTGTSTLATSTGDDALAWAAVALFVLLLAAWVTAAVRTAHGALWTGTLLRPA